nr:bifunctional DNA primase/polymerase [Afipia sp. GAS231]
MDADTVEGHGVDGIANLQALIDANGPLPETRMAESPTGSKHCYFKYSAGVKITNSDSKLAPGVDVRGEGGMVLAPPSVKPGVGAYEWINETDIADAPQWLIDQLVETTPEAESKADQKADLQQTDLDLIRQAMAAIPNNDLGHKEWKDWGIRIYATGAPFEVFDMFSKKSKKNIAAGTQQAWVEITNSPPTRTGAGAIFKMADELAPGWRAAVKISDFIAYK